MDSPGTAQPVAHREVDTPPEPDGPTGGGAESRLPSAPTSDRSHGGSASRPATGLLAEGLATAAAAAITQVKKVVTAPPTRAALSRRRVTPPLWKFATAVGRISVTLARNTVRSHLQGPQGPQRPFAQSDPQLVDELRPALDALEEYHDYRVVGLDNIPQEGPAIILFEHSLATYDLILLGYEVLKRTGRMMHPLIADQLIATPLFGRAALDLGGVRATHQNIERLLAQGELVALAPDGVRGWIHPTDSNKYHVDWSDRRGFVIKALQTGAPVLTTACPAADDIFDVYDNPVTRAAYQRFRVPLPVFFGKYGLPGSLAAKPAELVQVVSEPIRLPQIKDLGNSYRDLTIDLREVVDRCQHQLITAMNRTIAEALLARM